MPAAVSGSEAVTDAAQRSLAGGVDDAIALGRAASGAVPSGQPGTGGLVQNELPGDATISLGGTSTSGTGAGDGWGGSFASPSVLQLLGADGDLFARNFRALPVMISTTASIVAWAAFLMFGKRRRDGDPPAPDPVLANNAATGVPPAPSTTLVPGWPVSPNIDPNEAGMPRWRRPSLLAARKDDPLRHASTAVSLTFARGAGGPIEGKARRTIRYRLVRLLDLPDESRASEIAVLDQGDEVQLLEKSGTYWLVLCPDGRQGWLHQMVLGAAVEDDDEPLSNSTGIDDDVLSSFLNARNKSA